MNRSNYHNDGKRERCYFCPENRELQEHHIVPQRFGGRDAASNVVTVCKRCHGKLERLYNARFYEAFGIEDEEGSRYYHRPCDIVDCDNYAVEAIYVTGHFGDAGQAFRCEQHVDCASNPEVTTRLTR